MIESLIITSTSIVLVYVLGLVPWIKFLNNLDLDKSQFSTPMIDYPLSWAVLSCVWPLTLVAGISLWVTNKYIKE